MVQLIKNLFRLHEVPSFGFRHTMKPLGNWSGRGIFSSPSVASVCILVLLNGLAKVGGEGGAPTADAWHFRLADNAQALQHLREHTALDIELIIDNVTIGDAGDFSFEIYTGDTHVASANRTVSSAEFVQSGASQELSSWHGVVQVRAHQFGYTSLLAVLQTRAGGEAVPSFNRLEMKVLRDQKSKDNAFTYTTAAVVLLMFVNLGMALDLQRLKAIFMRPIGPVVGVCTRFLVMPLLGLGLGILCIPDSKPLQLALFITALTPSGGLANISIVFLKGNLNLSMSITVLNSLLSLGVFPLWILLLARVFYDEPGLNVPYGRLALSAAGIIIAVGLGILFRLLIPKMTKFIYRFLKPLSIALSLCVFILAVSLNSFVFQQVTPEIALATLCLPIVGYLVSYAVALVSCLSSTDSLTIGIETGMLSMSIPILLLQQSLEQPQADLTIVVPIMAGLLSLGEVLTFYILRRLLGCNKNAPDNADAFNHKQFA